MFKHFRCNQIKGHRTVQLSIQPSGTYRVSTHRSLHLQRQNFTQFSASVKNYCHGTWSQ